jgi:hypothetical protein
MSSVKMTHPETGATERFPAVSVPFHRAAGWVIDDSEDTPKCPTCGQPWPPPESPPQEADEKDQAPDSAGASSSEQPPRRRKNSRESDV